MRSKWADVRNHLREMGFSYRKSSILMSKLKFMNETCKFPQSKDMEWMAIISSICAKLYVDILDTYLPPSVERVTRCIIIVRHEVITNRREKVHWRKTNNVNGMACKLSGSQSSWKALVEIEENGQWWGSNLQSWPGNSTKRRRPTVEESSSSLVRFTSQSSSYLKSQTW